ncbi:MAG: ATP synthase F0 subunit C [Acidobacteria bacterium]|nr:ATP synthase F0 subunit C [Acidobacteriota bacterium]
MKKLFWCLAGLAFIAIGTPLFAQEPETVQTVVATNWVAITSGFAMAIASSFCGLAQGKAAAAAAEGMARNPGATAAIRLALILGLAFIESLALYTFVIIFIKVV